MDYLKKIILVTITFLLMSNFVYSEGSTSLISADGSITSEGVVSKLLLDFITWVGSLQKDSTIVKGLYIIAFFATIYAAVFHSLRRISFFREGNGKQVSIVIAFTSAITSVGALIMYNDTNFVDNVNSVVLSLAIIIGAIIALKFSKIFNDKILMFIFNSFFVLILVVNLKKVLVALKLIADKGFFFTMLTLIEGGLISFISILFVFYCFYLLRRVFLLFTTGRSSIGDGLIPEFDAKVGEVKNTLKGLEKVIEKLENAIKSGGSGPSSGPLS